MKKVTGIGGVFFKCKDPDRMKKWYKKHLGIDAGEYGATFHWDDEEHKKQAYTAWSTFSKDTDYFAPSEKAFMINYRVHDLQALLEELKKERVAIVDGPEEYEYGKFAWILDPEGNKIELWEPK